MGRVILHSNMNNSHAGIELLHRPELREKPLSTHGDPRRGTALCREKMKSSKNAEILDLRLLPGQMTKTADWGKYSPD